MDIADLQLLPFSEVKASIWEALNSGEPLTRYWGLIACSTFGKEAEEFFEKAGQLAASDKFPLVRVRAAGLSDSLEKPIRCRFSANY